MKSFHEFYELKEISGLSNILVYIIHHDICQDNIEENFQYRESAYNITINIMTFIAHKN